MRHFTLALALIAGTQLATAQPKAVGSPSSAPQTASMLDAAQQALHLRPVSPLKAKQRTPSVLYRAQTLNKYYSEGEGFSADPADETTYEYDDQGRVITETYHSASALPTDDNAYVRYIYEYDEYGNIASMEMLQGKTISKLANQYKMVYTYDDVVTDYLVSAIYYKWMKVTSSYSKKVLSSSYEINITRDDQGRVTLWESKEYDANSKPIIKNRITPTYDEATGLPSEVLYEEIYTTTTGAYDLRENQKFANIKWHKCDCQFLEPYADLKQGTNLISSADYSFCGSYWGVETVTYTDKEGEYYYEMPWQSGKGCDYCTWSYTDDNGSYKREKIEWADKNGNGVIDTDDSLTHGWDGQYEVYASTTIVTYNERGDMVENLFEQNNYGEKNWMTAEKHEYVYDEALGGAMTQDDSYGGSWTKGADGMPEYHPNSRLVWSNFIDITPSAISQNTVEGSRSFTLSDGAVHFGHAGNNVYAVYDAQGRMVMSGNAVGAKTVTLDRLSSGMYIIAVKEADGVKTVKFTK